MQPGWGHRWFLVLSLGPPPPPPLLPREGGGVESLRGTFSGDWGRGTVSCLTRVRSVRILAIMKRDGLGGLELELWGCSARTERSRGVAGVSC